MVVLHRPSLGGAVVRYSQHVGNGVYRHMSASEYNAQQTSAGAAILVVILLVVLSPILLAAGFGYGTYYLFQNPAMRALLLTVLDPAAIAASGVMAVLAMLFARAGVARTFWGTGRRRVFRVATDLVGWIVLASLLLDGAVATAFPGVVDGDTANPIAILAALVEVAQLLGVVAGVVASIVGAARTSHRMWAILGVLAAWTAGIIATTSAPMHWTTSVFGLWGPGLVGWAVLLLSTTLHLKNETPAGSLSLKAATLSAGRAAIGAATATGVGGRRAAARSVSLLRRARNGVSDRLEDRRPARRTRPVGRAAR